MNTNKEEKKRRRKIRQSYHTKFTRFKNASATGGVCFHLIIIYKRKKKKKQQQQQQLMNAFLSHS
jgi:hypothetical protein